MLGATAYIDDVEPGGGSFIYWPRSHGQVQDLLPGAPGADRRHLPGPRRLG